MVLFKILIRKISQNQKWIHPFYENMHTHPHNEIGSFSFYPWENKERLIIPEIFCHYIIFDDDNGTKRCFPFEKFGSFAYFSKTKDGFVLFCVCVCVTLCAWTHKKKTLISLRHFIPQWKFIWLSQNIYTKLDVFIHTYNGTQELEIRLITSFRFIKLYNEI